MYTQIPNLLGLIHKEKQNYILYMHNHVMRV